MFASIKKAEDIELLNQERHPDRPKTPNFVENSYNINIEQENDLKTHMTKIKKNQVTIIRELEKYTYLTRKLQNVKKVIICVQAVTIASFMVGVVILIIISVLLHKSLIVLN